MSNYFLSGMDSMVTISVRDKGGSSDKERGLAEARTRGGHAASTPHSGWQFGARRSAPEALKVVVFLTIHDVGFDDGDGNHPGPIYASIRCTRVLAALAG
jgi:hypothetical protein